MAIGVIAGYLLVMRFGSNPVAVAALFGVVGFMLYGPDTLLCGAASIQVAGEANAVAVAGLVNGMGRTYTVIVTVVPLSRSTVDITAMVVQNMVQAGDSFPAYEISMLAQSSNGPFVAERPMYSNTGSGGTQGGSDVIGYIGG